MSKCLHEFGLIKWRKKWKMVLVDKTSFRCKCKKSAKDVSVLTEKETQEFLNRICPKCKSKPFPELERQVYYKCSLCGEEGF